MRFGRTLQRSKYPPWADKYIDYDKLKRLLREGGSEDGSTDAPDEEDEWTEEDEGAFVEELVNVQLEKVHAFQSEKSQQLQERTSQCESRLEPWAIRAKEGNQEGQDNDEPQKAEEIDGDTRSSPEEKDRVLREVMEELDNITKETNELEKYSRINYTGFLKAAKKHDRKRGHSYRVRPLLQVRLAALPFNKEDYSPLLYRLSTMYSFARQNLGREGSRVFPIADSQSGGETYTSHKCKYSSSGSSWSTLNSHRQFGCTPKICWR